MAAAALGSYIRGVMMPLVELPRGRSSTRQIRYLDVSSYIGGRRRVWGRCQRLKELHREASGK
jgi:hypothetical protein